MTKTFIRIIAVLEIVGGVTGMVLIAWSLVMLISDLTSVLFSLILLGINALSLVAGIALWKNNSFGRMASIAVQLIGVPKIVSPVMIFLFSFGFDFWIHLTIARGFTTVGFQTIFLSNNQLFFLVDNVPISVGISLSSVASLIVLIKSRTVPTEGIAELPPPPPDDLPPPPAEQNYRSTRIIT